MKNSSKYFIWILWFAFIIYLWLGNQPLKFDFFYMAGIDLHMVVIYFAVTTLIYAFTIATGKRGLCHSLCWMAPFMVIGEKLSDFLHIPRVRLKAEQDNCISCGQCNKRCPMSLNVQEMVKTKKMDSTECISCMECVDVCPKKVIQCGIYKKVK